jgi:hypothetical protein
VDKLDLVVANLVQGCFPADVGVCWAQGYDNSFQVLKWHL